MLEPPLRVTAQPFGPGTGPGPAIVTITPATTEPSAGQSLITRLPGRQALHDQPEFSPGASGGVLNCIASGHALRRYVDEDGVERVVGDLPNLVVVATMFRDIPAAHAQHAECLVAVRRRDPREILVQVPAPGR
jgi:hypothetical protein